MSPITLTGEEMPDPAVAVSRFANRIARHRATGGALDRDSLEELLMQAGHSRQAIDAHLPAELEALNLR